MKCTRWSSGVALEIVLATLTCVIIGIRGNQDANATTLTSIFAVGAATVAGVSAVRAWRMAGSVVAATAGFVVFTTYTVLLDTLHLWLPTADTLRAWQAIDLRLVMVWGGAVLATTFILRARALFAPIIPLMLTLVVMTTLTAARGGIGLSATLVAVCSSMSIVFIRMVRYGYGLPERFDGGARGALRRVVTRSLFQGSMMVIVLGVGGIVTYMIPIATGDDRLDFRQLLPARVSMDEGLSPLVLVKPQLREQVPSKLFTVRADTDAPGLVRTAALEQFDGAVWTSQDTFVREGHDLAHDPNGGHHRMVTSRIVIKHLDGPYLPVLGWPVHVDLDGIGFSSESGVLVSDDQVGQGMSYTLISEVHVDDGGLAVATPYYSRSGERYTALPPGMPVVVSIRARELTSGYAEPYAKLVAINSYLRTLPYNLDARPGHSYDAIARLFGDQPAEQLGYAEQHASAFAVLARSLGLPARVAVGYRLNPERRQGDIYEVTSHDAHAWAEVNFTGYGWVSFDPTDVGGRTTTASPTAVGPAPAHPSATAEPTGTAPLGGHTAVNSERSRTTHAARDIAFGALLVAVAVAPAGVVLAKRKRRRRRRCGDPPARVVGAWQEATDLLMSYKVPCPPSATAEETAACAIDWLGCAARAAVDLAPLATAATFCPDPLDDDGALHAWDLEARLRRDLRRASGVIPWALAWASLRPFLSVGRYRRAPRRSALSATRSGSGARWNAD